MAAAAAGVLVYALITGQSQSPGTPDRTQRLAQAQDVRDFLAEIARLDEQANMRLAVVGQMLLLERQRKRLAELKSRLKVIDPIGQIQEQMDHAARTMFVQAERERRELSLPKDAAETYRRTIALFPASKWARVARQKLDELTRG